MLKFIITEQLSANPVMLNGVALKVGVIVEDTGNTLDFLKTHKAFIKFKELKEEK